MEKVLLIGGLYESPVAILAEALSVTHAFESGDWGRRAAVKCQMSITSRGECDLSRGRVELDLLIE